MYFNKLFLNLEFAKCHKDKLVSLNSQHKKNQDLQAIMKVNISISALPMIHEVGINF